MHIKRKIQNSFLLNRLQILRDMSLSKIESFLENKYGQVGIRKYPPVFIIGAPRCGSTLLYKILTEKYNFIYFTNFTSKYYSIPIIGNFIAKIKRIKQIKGNYSFKYGKIDGLGSPHECWEFWYRWFPRGLHIYVAIGETNKSILRNLRSEISGVSYFSRRPMIFKNLYNSMRIAPILESIPEASILICKRNYLDNALSILKCRIENNKDKNKWWSLPPKEIDILMDKDYADQIAGQISYTYNQIEEDKKLFGSEKFMDIHYENFCEDVHGTLNSIENFLKQRGCHLRKKWDVPARFTRRKYNKENFEDYETMKMAVSGYFSQNLG